MQQVVILAGLTSILQISLQLTNYCAIWADHMYQANFTPPLEDTNTQTHNTDPSHGSICTHYSFPQPERTLTRANPKWEAVLEAPAQTSAP